MNIKELILNTLTKQGSVKVADIVSKTGFSRVYINRFFRELRGDGKIILVGKANQACYVLAEKDAVLKMKKGITHIYRTLINRGLSEEIVLDEIERNTGILLDLSANIVHIVEYGFTEMLNNAIEHSRSKKIEIKMERDSTSIRFEVIDRGVGIFRHVMQKRKLKSELEAIQDLVKGKQTTAPKEHTGEGIFFTSKGADFLIIQSSKKKLIFNTSLDDVFIEDIKNSVSGTRVRFVLACNSKRRLEHIFKEYSEGSYEFSKTKVVVRLYKMDTDYISRSQARRIISGLEKFKIVILDFRAVKTVGQAFVDELFRVWKARHPDIKIAYQNANENIDFMIKRGRMSGR